MNSTKGFFRIVRPWQWIKHSIYVQYLTVWASKVGSTAKTIWVIDAFAGAGEYVDETTGETSPGSPLHAALFGQQYNESPTRKAQDKMLRLICIERDPEHYAALTDRLKGFPFATVLQGEFGDHASTIAEMIEDDPALVLLDPIGVKSIDASTCRTLLHRKGKTDAFVNVQLAVVHRTRGQLLPSGDPDPEIPTAAANADNIDRFFGSSAWRVIGLNGKPSHEQEREYIQLYFDTVIGSRYRSKVPYPVRRSYRGKPKYYLVHIADHPDAEWLINDLLASVESRLFVISRQRKNPNALEGFATQEDEARIEELRACLSVDILDLLEAGKEPLTYEGLCLSLRDRYFGLLKQGDYSKVLKRLVAEEAVSRQRKGVRPKLAPEERIWRASG